MRRVADEAYQWALVVLTESRGLLDHVAAQLLRRESLDAAEFEEVVAAGLVSERAGQARPMALS